MEPNYRDGTIVINGRDPAVVQTMMVVAGEYNKIGHVYAVEAGGDGIVYTPEGAMSFSKGDMILSDIPPTHAWPVKRAVFDATYVRVPRPGLDAPVEPRSAS